MPNLRVLYDNALDRRLSLTASTTSGSLVAANLASDAKGLVHRSTGTSVTYTVTWTDAEAVSMVVLPYTNLTATATIRVKGFSDTAGTVQLFNTGIEDACRYVPPALRGLPSGVNSFAYGGGTPVVKYFTEESIKRLTVELTDTDNTAGYIESARLLCGTYWEPAIQADVGVQLSIEDRSSHERTEAGDLRTERKTRGKRLSLNLQYMKATDRDALWEIMRGNGIVAPVFLSLVPLATDVKEEWMHQVYGKLSDMSAMTYQFVNSFSAPMDIEEI